MTRQGPIRSSLWMNNTLIHPWGDGKKVKERNIKNLASQGVTDDGASQVLSTNVNQ